MAGVKNLSFEKPDFDKFQCLKYAYEAGKIGGTMGAVLNAANEIAVYAFLENKIKFLDIQKLIKTLMNKHKSIRNPDIKQVIGVDKKTRTDAIKTIQKL